MNKNETMYFEVEDFHELEGTDSRISAVKLNGEWYDLDLEEFVDTGYISHKLLDEDMVEWLNEDKYFLEPVYVEAVPGTDETFIIGYKVTLFNEE